MQHSFNTKYQPGPCVNCGKPNGGVMASSDCYLVPCCSEKCCLEAKKKIERNTATKEYKAVLKKQRSINRKLSELKHDGLYLTDADDFLQW